MASHIVPWAKRVDSRLDPANGLLLFWSYDRLFDQGFITITEEMRVDVVPWADRCSPSLAAMLAALRGGGRPQAEEVGHQG